MESPTLRRRRLGRALRSLRDEAGLTGDEAGAAVERSGSWISRVEAGRVGLRTRDLKDLLELYHVADPDRRRELEALAREGKQRGWWSKYSETINESYALFIGLEAEARSFSTYEHGVVPGLLQTRDYCRAIIQLTGPPSLTRDVLEARVALRMARQARIAEVEPPQLRFVLDEAVLHRPIGGRKILREQLAHLVEVATSPNVDLRVIPFDHQNYLVTMNSFVIMSFPHDPDIVYFETLSSGTYEDGQQETGRYRTIFELLAAAALDPVASTALVRETSDQLRLRETAGHE